MERSINISNCRVRCKISWKKSRAMRQMEGRTLSKMFLDPAVFLSSSDLVHFPPCRRMEIGMRKRCAKTFEFRRVLRNNNATIKDKVIKRSVNSQKIFASSSSEILYKIYRSCSLTFYFIEKIFSMRFCLLTKIIRMTISVETTIQPVPLQKYWKWKREKVSKQRCQNPATKCYVSQKSFILALLNHGKRGRNKIRVRWNSNETKQQGTRVGGKWKGERGGV